MNKDYLKELNEIRKDLEISKEDFKKLLVIVLNYQKLTGNYLSQEEMFLLLEDAMVNIDYCDEMNAGLDLTGAGICAFKTVEESFNRTLNNYGYQKIKVKE